MTNMQIDTVPIHMLKPDRITDIVQYVKNNKTQIDELLIQHGALLLRGFNLYSVSQFSKASDIILNHQFNEYIYRSTPRSTLGGRIYTASDYPANRHIPLHNEFSYFRAWPSRIIFFCVIEAETGGATPVADSRKVLQRLSKEIVDKFEKLGVKYVRHYTSGIDLSWQEVFQTEDKQTVETFCREHDIQFEWGRKGAPYELRTEQVCQATTIHPITKEKVWFNQAHLFHISSLPEEDRIALVNELGAKYLTRQSYYGDGSELENDVLNCIRKAYSAETLQYPWNKGDLMLLDNVLFAHGRTPYSGLRKIAVSMG